MESFNPSEGYSRLVLKKLYKSEYPFTGSAWTYSDSFWAGSDLSFMTGVSALGFEISAACLRSSSTDVDPSRRPPDESLPTTGGVCSIWFEVPDCFLLSSTGLAGWLSFAKKNHTIKVVIVNAGRLHFSTDMVRIEVKATFLLSNRRSKFI